MFYPAYCGMKRCPLHEDVLEEYSGFRCAFAGKEIDDIVLSRVSRCPVDSKILQDNLSEYSIMAERDKFLEDLDLRTNYTTRW